MTGISAVWLRDRADGRLNGSSIDGVARVLRDIGFTDRVEFFLDPCHGAGEGCRVGLAAR